MGCLLDGYVSQCGNVPAGGVKSQLLVADADDIDSIVTGANGEITSIVMKTTSYFYSVDLRKNLNGFNEPLEKNDAGALTGTAALTAVIAGRSQESRNFIMEAARCCRLVLIHKEGNGRSWLWGYTDKEIPGENIGANYAELSGSDSNTGTAISDASLNTLTFTWETNEMARIIDSAFDPLTLLAP